MVHFAKTILMNVIVPHAKMELFVIILLTNTSANVRSYTWGIIARHSTSACMTNVSIVQYIKYG